MGLKASEIVADARAAMSFLKRKNFVKGDKIGARGFCVGGHVTYLTAYETEVKAAASFCGLDHPRGDAARLTCTHTLKLPPEICSSL